jgi:hypothetical protein
MSGEQVTRAASDPSGTGLGRTVPAWRLRVVLAMATLITVVTVAVVLAPATWLVAVLVAVAAGTVAQPRSHAATVLLAVVLVITVGAEGPGWWLPPLVLGLHATHVGASLAALVPLAADIEVDSLRPAMHRFVAVQAVAQVTAIFVVVIAG